MNTLAEFLSAVMAPFLELSRAKESGTLSMPGIKALLDVHHFCPPHPSCAVGGSTDGWRQREAQMQDAMELVVVLDMMEDARGRGTSLFRCADGTTAEAGMHISHEAAQKLLHICLDRAATSLLEADDIPLHKDDCATLDVVRREDVINLRHKLLKDAGVKGLIEEHVHKAVMLARLAALRELGAPSARLNNEMTPAATVAHAWAIFRAQALLFTETAAAETAATVLFWNSGAVPLHNKAVELASSALTQPTSMLLGACEDARGLVGMANRAMEEGCARGVTDAGQCGAALSHLQHVWDLTLRRNRLTAELGA